MNSLYIYSAIPTAHTIHLFKSLSKTSQDPVQNSSWGFKFLWPSHSICYRFLVPLPPAPNFLFRFLPNVLNFHFCPHTYRLPANVLSPPCALGKLVFIRLDSNQDDFSVKLPVWQLERKKHLYRCGFKWEIRRSSRVETVSLMTSHFLWQPNKSSFYICKLR